jgi:predicted ester cyclase
MHQEISAMALIPTEMDTKMDEHFGFEARDDVVGVLSTLASDATHDIVGWPAGPTQGRDNARPFYETMFADLADGKVTCIQRHYGDGFLVDESLWEGRADGSPFGFEGRGRPLSFRLLHVIDFTDDGMIQKEAVWCDMLAIMQQLSKV